MGSKVSDEAWAVQDGLVMPVNMGSSDFSGLSMSARDVENGDIQPYPWTVSKMTVS